jgi:DNA-binding FadR family transcriptional regulator
MRILETEGLVTVRRGNVGGAVVHRPTALNVAQTLGVVLVSRQADVLDVARAIREVEPACAALCATRKDRRRKVVPPLMRLQKQAMASLHDLIEATRLSREFHETMVQLCGNETLIVLVGALEAVWSSHENTWAHRTVDPSDVPVDSRREALLAHDEMIGLIDAGDEAAVRRLAAAHLAVVQRYPTTGTGQTRIDLAALRGYIER